MARESDRNPSFTFDAEREAQPTTLPTGAELAAREEPCVLRPTGSAILTREPTCQGDHDSDQPADNGAVEANELKVGTHTVFDLANEEVGLEGLEVLAHGETDLVVVAAEQILGRPPHPTVEGSAPVGVLQSRVPAIWHR
jgi:hypothetical protein